MSSKRKTRFMVNFNGMPCELVAVEERSDQSLIVRPKHEQRAKHHRTGAEAPIEQYRFSVHISPKSSGTTLKLTKSTLGDPAETSVQFIRDSKTSLLAILHTKIWAQLGPVYKSTGTSRDTYVTIGDFNVHDFTTLITSIVVADRDHVLPPAQGFSLHQAQFRRFKVGIYSAFANSSANNQSLNLMTPTFRNEVDVDEIAAASGDALIELNKRDKETEPEGNPSIRNEDLGRQVNAIVEFGLLEHLRHLFTNGPADFRAAARDIRPAWYGDVWSLARQRSLGQEEVLVVPDFGPTIFTREP